MNRRSQIMSLLFILLSSLLVLTEAQGAGHHMKVRLLKSSESQVLKLQRQYDQLLIEQTLEEGRVKNFLNLKNLKIIGSTLTPYKMKDSCQIYRFQMMGELDQRPVKLNSQARVCPEKVHVYPHHKHQADWIEDLDQQLKSQVRGLASHRS